MSRISVVIPVYNQERYLDKSLPSVINQTFDDIEIIVVNDGSTDSSIELIKKYSEQDSRIRIIEKPNGGLVDATLVGIKNSSGEYIAFLDPDDYWGEDFLDNLVCNSEGEDVVASGFFYDASGKLSPYMLSETKKYVDDQVGLLRRSFLYDKNVEGIPHSLFFSRWNKIYKKEVVDKACKIFDECKGITLGEDSIFTYLTLKYASSVKTIAGVNSYYYNVGNQNSMMKSGAIDKYVEKARLAKDTMLKIVDNNDDKVLAYALYYYLLETMYTRSFNSGKNDYYLFRKHIDSDKDYRKAVKLISESYNTFRKRFKVLSRAYLPKNIYWVNKKQISCKAKWYKNLLSDFLAAVKLSRKKKTNFKDEFTHKRSRTNAFLDLDKYMPLLEERITPFLKMFENQKTDLQNSKIEKNIFVFWWDGFECAPEIVKRCLASVRRNYLECNIIEISKDNYKNYTSINPIIDSDFLNGKISVQTFSDILRFNLLKNNGGLWIDATIFFSDRFPMFENLSDKSFESLCFSTSEDYFKYDGISCTWSGYFIASRKGGILVTAMDKVFEEYYLKYRTYNIYFFIDAALMLAKKYKIDCAVLDKVQYSSHDMFLLSKVLYQEYDDKCIYEIKSIPQKLAWFGKGKVSDNTFYQKIVT